MFQSMRRSVKMMVGVNARCMFSKWAGLTSMELERLKIGLV